MFRTVMDIFSTRGTFAISFSILLSTLLESVDKFKEHVFLLYPPSQHILMLHRTANGNKTSIDRKRPAPHGFEKADSLVSRATVRKK